MRHLDRDLSNDQYESFSRDFDLVCHRLYLTRPHSTEITVSHHVALVLTTMNGESGSNGFALYREMIGPIVLRL